MEWSEETLKELQNNQLLTCLCSKRAYCMGSFVKRLREKRNAKSLLNIEWFEGCDFSAFEDTAVCVEDLLTRGRNLDFEIGDNQITSITIKNSSVI